MRKFLHFLTILFLVGIVVTSCQSTPENVIPPDRMAKLLVDFHKGEALTEIRYSDYRNDTAKFAVMKAVFDRNGVTPEQFDSSLVWYGHNLEEYMEIYDDVIAELESEVEKAGNVALVAGTLVGDSVNAWSGEPHYVITHRSPSEFLKFKINADETWENGDSYTLQMKVFNRYEPITMGMYVDYTDGSTDMRLVNFSEDGWSRLTMVVDSLRTPVSVYGFTHFRPIVDEEIFVDSVSLVRRRFDPLTYRQVYTQQQLKYDK